MTAPTTADFVGLADTIYRRTDLTKEPSFQINTTTYKVLDVIDHSSSDGYYGAVLLDQSTNTVFVVNRGTEPTSWRDWATDVVMAGTDQNLQWQDANALAQSASQYAATNGSTVYTVGHSLGGTLAQMQAAINGWNGVTFNAYGSSEVLGGLGYTVDPDQPNITNYRTLFDVVSESSTQIGNVVTLETPQDKALLASPYAVAQLEFVATVVSDHLVSNFYNSQNSDPKENGISTGTPTYMAADMFASPMPTDVTTLMAQSLVNGFGRTLAVTREILATIYNTTSIHAIAGDVSEWISGKYKSGEAVVIPADYYLLKNALNPSAAYNVYRASLAAGSPVVLNGIDPSEVQDDTLWSPGQTSGLTKDYLIARNGMVQAAIKTGYTDGGTGTSDDGDTYVYTDLTESADPLYTLAGTGHDTYSIKFGTDGNDVLSPTAGTLSEVFGGPGDDMLVDGSGNSTLEGGAGDDHYWVDGTQAGTDHILDTDGQGDVNWELSGGGSEILTGGDAVSGGSAWKSADGSITYTEVTAADETTELEIHSGNKTVYVDDFTNGELGITLNSGGDTTPGAGNLGNFTKTTYSDHTEYQDLSGTGGGDSMVGVNAGVANYNILEGEGNASYIYAGNGNNEVFANDMRYSPVGEVFSYPASVVIQGGFGDQLLVGMGDDGSQGNGNETIIGGDMDADTTAWTTIDGGGTFVNAILAGGSQNSLIFGGIGTDTIMAGSALVGSGKPDPMTIAMAGLSFWASSSQGTEGSETVTGEPEVSIPAFSDPSDFQINLALNQLDGSYAAPFGLLGSEWDTGTDISPWKDSNGTPIPLPGSLIVGGNGEAYLAGNSGNDTIMGGTPTNLQSGVVDEVLVGGGGADVIYGGGGNEWIYTDLSPAADANWANLDPADADTIYGPAGNAYIYGSGGNDVIYGGSGNYTINTGNGNAYVETGSGSTIVNGGTGNDTIIAGSGVDSIATGDGNDFVCGGDGQSTISAGSGDDIFQAGTGTTVYNAGTGTESYRLGLEAGNQTIMGASSASGIDVSYADGITSADVVANCDASNNLILTDKATGSHLQIDDYFDGESNVSVSFGDGVTWGTADILQASLDGIQSGTTGSDDIVGTTGADVIDGKGGDDVEVGNGGNDTFVYNSGYGALEIGYELGYTLKLDQAPSELYPLQSISHGGTDLILQTSSGDIRLDGMATSPYASSNVVEFSDGSTISVDQLASQVRYIYDGPRDDVFRLDESSGSQSLSNALWASQIDLYYTGGISSTDIVARGDLAGNLILTNKSTGTYFQLTDYFGDPVKDGFGGYGPDVFLHFSDGVTWGNAEILDEYVAPDDGNDSLVGSHGSDTITGGPGNDTIVGVKGNNLLTGGTGDSTIYGGSGADTIEGGTSLNELYGGTGRETYVFNVGDGSDTVIENASSPGTDVFKFGSGISVPDVTFSLDSSGDLLITLGTESTSTVDIANFTTAGDSLHQVGTFQFADGTVYTRSQILQMASPPNLLGTTGDDLLVGSPGADLFDGAGGNDTAVGNGGDDTFIFNAGYGDLEINENYAGGQQPVLQLGAGITTSGLQVSAAGNNLVLTDGVSGDQITLDNENASDGDGVALVQMADGTTLSGMRLFQLAHEIDGTAGSDTLTGTSGVDFIDGKGGGDSVTGNGGNDTFVFNAGYGHLEINEGYASGGQPMLQLGAGIAASTLRVSTDATNLSLTDGITGDEVQLDGMWYGDREGVASVQLADGTTLTASQLRQMEMIGTSGDDTLYGTSAADLIDGRGGSYDFVIGESGSDTFVFDAGYGGLDIMEDSFGDQPVLRLGTGITASMLRVSAAGDDLVLEDGVVGDWIQLDDENQPDGFGGTYGVALVQLADGTTLSAAQLIQMSHERIGTAGNDTLTGTTDAELFDGEGGTDSVIGNGGNDTIIFNSGYGQLTINESYTSGQQPELDLGAGITASALHVAASGNNLVLTDGVSGDKVTLISMWSSSTHGVSTVQLADGTTFTRDQLIQMEMTGTTGNDTLTGTSGADLLDGKGGVDSIIGGGGNDTFVFDSGYGALTINEKFTSGQQPVLQLGDGITTSTLRAVKSGNNLVLTDGVSGDKITLYDMWSSSSYGVEEAQLADGTVLTRSQLIQMEMTGTIGNDTIYGTSGADLIDGKGGNDSVIGSGGNDTFVFNSGYGHLTVNESFTSGQAPVLMLGTGIAAAALRVTTNGTNLFLKDGISGDQITLNTMWTSSTKGVATVKLASGTTFTRSQLIQMEMTGTTGNDTIYGTSGADLIDGKGGSDSITGEGGNDTFVFDSGYGHLTINDTFTSGQTPVLKMGTGITTSNLQVKTSGSNLLLTDGVTGDQVTLIKMATSSTNGVATVQLADGTTLTRSQLLGMETSSTKALIAETGSSIHDTTGSEATANQTSMPASLGVPDPAPNAVSTGSRTPTLALTPDVTPTASQAPNLLAPGGPATPLNDVVVGAGNLHLSATTPNISSAAGPMGNAQPSRGAKRTDAHLGQPSTAGAQSTVQQAAKGSLQSSTASNDTAQRANSLPSMSTLDTSLGQPRFPAQTQPEDVTVTPGAPADPFLSDIDDPVGGANLPLVADTGGASRPWGVVAQSGIFSPAFGQRQLVNTSSAADAMVKALTGRNGLRSLLAGSDFASEAQDEIRLQGGESWLRSSVDRTLAALPSNGGGTEDLSSRLTDLAHAQLVSAIASFRAGASSESMSTIPPNPDTYTIAAAAGMH